MATVPIHRLTAQQVSHAVITADDCRLPISNCRMSTLTVSNRQSEIGNRQS